MILGSVDTWPKPLLDFLRGQHDVLVAHANHLPMPHLSANSYWTEREQAAATVLDLLQSTELCGWHCTRLTGAEVADIRQNGMRLPSLQFLRERIGQIHAAGLIDKRSADRLLAENQADDEYRRGLIWFFFSPPRLLGQSGIERFFRRWGGESLFNSHEIDREMSDVLKAIGRPCLIEVKVPIAMFGPTSRLGDKVIRHYLLSRGFDTQEDVQHEGAARQPIPMRNVLRFVFHHEAEFAKLTGCDQWSPPL